MSMKNTRGRFQNDLQKANTELARLGGICEQQGKQISQLVNVLCAILMKEHKGSIDLSPDDIRNSQGMFVNCRSLNLMGMMRVSAKLPGSDKIQVPGENGQTPPGAIPVPPTPAAAAPETSVEPEEPQAPLTCPEAWHADPEAPGIRCSVCGDSRKLAPAMA